MINLDKQEIAFQCPRCNFFNNIQLRQAKLRDVVICRGCKANIRLDDQMNEIKKIIRSIRRSMAEIEKTLKGMSLKIRI